MAQELDFFYFIGSLYSYFAVMRAETAAALQGISLRWRPFNLRAIMVEQDNVPRRNPVKMRYTLQDVERRAAYHGLPFRAGFPYPIDPDLVANRVAVIAAHEGWAEAFSKALYRGWIADHHTPHDPAVLGAVLKGLGKNPDAILAQANGTAVKERLDSETAVARELGIFGAPTFVWGDQIFWGDDRLEDALAWAAAHPLKAKT
ncbi:MAG TPA: 2-hydroxychromene-2-carboxylate isomerase [bacterium]